MSATETLSGWDRIKAEPVTVGLLTVILGPICAFHLVVASYLAYRVDKLADNVTDVRTALAAQGEQIKALNTTLSAHGEQIKAMDAKVETRLDALDKTQAQIIALMHKQTETLNGLAVHLRRP